MPELRRDRPVVAAAGSPGLWLGIALAAGVALTSVLWTGGESGPWPWSGVGLGLGVLAALVAVLWRRQRERASAAPARALLAAAEAGADGLLVTDAESRVVYANPAFARLLAGGDALSTSLQRLAALVADDEAAAAELARIRAGAAAGVATTGEIRVSLPPGTGAWLRLEAQPAGTHVVWRVTDVTAEREMAAARRDEEAAFADLLDALPVGYLSADAGGRIVYANQTVADWLGTPAADLVSGEVRLGQFVLVGAVPVVGGGPVEVTLAGPGGAAFRALFVAAAGGGGEADHVRTVVLRDVMPRPAPDDAGKGMLLGPEQRLNWLFDQAPVGIVLVALDGVVADCNRAFLDLLGLHRDAVVGQPLADRLAREDRGEVAAQLSKVVMGTARAAVLEARMPGRGQRELVASLYASPVEGADGDVNGLVLHFIDTTEHKNLEVQFAQSQKMQAVGQLAGGVAHDFNNLLTAMIGFSDLLLDRHGPDDPSFADIMQIKQNANRAANLVRQLLAFSRKQTLEPVLIDPAEALSELSNLLGRLIGEKIELVMEHGRDLGFIRVDRGQFDQVMINLAVNARDAMPGGGTLTLVTRAEDVDAPMQRGHDLIDAGAYVCIDVTDTGVGIPRENLERIFEPFFSTKEVGTGLGLSTVYGIVHQTDGHIRVDSAPGEGTTFGIYLPRYDESRAPADTAPASARAKVVALPIAGAVDTDLTGAGVVLLVEDEDAVRMFGSRALRNKGYRVLEADNGEAALDVINAADDTIDLIISDVVMPGMDGHTLVRLVRQEHPEVKVILMSGYAEDVVGSADARDPTIHFLQKPFSLKTLAGTVKDVLAG